MKISLIIPVYNEARHLAEFLAKIDALELPAEKELVLVDDCSTDGTGAIIDGFRFQTKATVVLHQPRNAGKGSAIRLGLARATGEVVGIQDADFEYDPRDIASLVQPLLAGEADVVFGSRFRGAQVHRTYHYLINLFLTILSNICTGLYLTDMETCYKFFRRDVVTNLELEAQRFGFEPEVTAKIARLHLRVQELPIRYYPRNYLQGKKIGWQDGFAAVRHIIYYSFFVSPKRCFKPTLPERYRPLGGNWL